MTPPTSLVVLFAASLLAGAQNALAGGGSFVTLPALLLAGVMNFSALLIFLWSPDVRWGPTAVVCVGAIGGGLSGVWLLRRVPERVLRGGVLATGAALTVGLFLRQA